MSDLVISIKYDFITLTLMMVILASLIVINTLLGTITAWTFGEWKSSKFWHGIIKNLLIALCMALFFMVLEVLPAVLQRAGVVIPTEVVTVIEVFAMLTVAIIKYVKDIYLSFIKLLGVTEEEVKSARDERG